MNYEERVAAAKKAGEGKRVSVRRIVLEPKQTLTGVFLGRELVPAKKKGFPDSYSYKWDATDGIETCFLSSAFDKTDGERLAKGNLYEITYIGKRAISEGRTLKEYEVIDFGPAGEPEEEEGEEE